MARTSRPTREAGAADDDEKMCGGATATDRFSVEDPSAPGPSRVVDVSRKGLFKWDENAPPTLAGSSSWDSKSPLEKHLISTMQLRGPISVSTFMKDALTNPAFGYYATQDPFGKEGDFVTSPEISQLFAEIVGVWIQQMWEQLGKPSPFRLVELGPGRGTLMAGVMKVLNQVHAIPHMNLELHMVENSFKLQREQAQKMGCTRVEDLEKWQEKHKRVIDIQWNTNPERELGREHSNDGEFVDGIGGSSPPIATGFGAFETRVQAQWHMSLDMVPRGVPFALIAHEFFDALPVCQFEFRGGEWKERLVDVSSEDDGLGSFRFVLSPRHTPASASLASCSPSERRPGANMGDLDVPETPSEGSLLETCSDAESIARDIGVRCANDMGVALLMDYGQDRPSANSLRAISGHAFSNPLSNVGKSDLTADVDFSALRRAALAHQESAGAVDVVGPTTQREWLQSLGIEARLARLLKNPTFSSSDKGSLSNHQGENASRAPASSHVRDQIKDARIRAAVEGYHRIVDDDQMGKTYKVMSIMNSGVSVPLGF